MKKREVKLTGYSAWLTTTGGNCSDDQNPMSVWSDSAEAEKALPSEGQRWPVPEGRIDLYYAPYKRCAMMLFYPLGQKLPKNGYYVNGWGEEWLYLHSPITSFAPALTMLGLGVKVYLFFNPSNCAGGLDTATGSPLPRTRSRRS